MNAIKKVMDKLPDAYIVGGAVRDSILGKQPHDIDIVTSALPHKILNTFEKSYDVGGSKFGTILVIMDGEKIEVTTMRKEITGGRHPKVVFTNNIYDDLQRRDFTFNAMAIDKNGIIIDPFHGIKDLQKGIVRSVYDPYETLDEIKGDPLRSIRAVRFAHKLFLDIDPTLQDAIEESDLSSLSGERIYDELTKMFDYHAKTAIQYLDKYGILKKILPEINAMKGCEHDPKFHPEGDVYEHTLMVLEALRHEASNQSMLCKMAGLLHDVGKPSVRDGVTYHGHDNAGVEIATNIMKRFKRSNQEIEAVAFVVSEHMKIHYSLVEMRAGKRRKLYDSPHFNILMDVVRADSTPEEYLKVKNFIDNDPARNKPIRSFLNGHEIMEYGFIGKIIGTIQKDIIENQINGTINNKEEALEYLKHKYIGDKI